MNGMSLGGFRVGTEHPPFIVAEMSGNHNQSLDRAFEIAHAAKEAGAHALKIQTYTPDTMTLNLGEGAFRIEDGKSLWSGESLYDLYRKSHTPWEWHAPLFDYCRKLGLLVFSTPFDASAVDFLEGLGAPCYKIASFENTDLPLIRKAAATGKPMLLSTGMASVAELEESVAAAREAGCRDLVLLKCTSSYPAPASACNLRTLPHLRDLFQTAVGLSDHTLGTGVAVAAVALGACVIEKHFTLDRAEGGVDSAFSLEPAELKALVVETRRAFEALGAVRYGLTPAETASRQFRRSLYVVEDMQAGEVFSAATVRAIRPGFGLPPKHLDGLLGKKARRALKRGTPLSWDAVE